MPDAGVSVENEDLRALGEVAGDRRHEQHRDGGGGNKGGERVDGEVELGGRRGEGEVVPREGDERGERSGLHGEESE